MELGAIVEGVKVDPSPDVLERAIAHLRDRDSLKAKKLLAEVYFLLAQHHLKEGNNEEATKLANQSISIYEVINVSSIENAIPILTNLLPDLMHQDVVRQRVLEKV